MTFRDKIGVQLSSTEISVELAEWLTGSGRRLELDDFGRIGSYPNPREFAKSVDAMIGKAKCPIGLHGPVPTQSFAALDRDIQKIVDSRFANALQAAEAVGAEYMVIHSPFLFLGLPYQTSSGESLEDVAVNHAADCLEPTIELAKRCSCTLVIENVWDTRPDLLLRLVAMIGSPWVKLSFDVGHARTAGYPFGLPEDLWVKQIAPYLSHVHLSDTDGIADRHWPIGSGNLNWSAILCELELADRRSSIAAVLEYRRGDRTITSFERSLSFLGAIQ